MQRNYRERLAPSTDFVMQEDQAFPPARGASRGRPQSEDFSLQQLAMLSMDPIFRHVQRWWLRRAERHYLMCADIEQQRAREAHQNVAYYQKRAALARSARI